MHASSKGQRVVRWLGLAASLAVVSPTLAAAAGPPPGRAYELVSPGAAKIGDVVRVPSMAPDGDTVGYTSLEAGPDASSAYSGSYSVARRTSSGWISSDANSPLGPIAGANATHAVLNYSPTFDKALYASSVPLVAGDHDHYLPDLFVADIPHGPVTWLTQGDSTADSFPVASVLVGASADLSRVVFQFLGPFMPETPNGGLFTADAQGVHLTSVLPDDSPATFPSYAASQGSRYLGDWSGGVPAPYGGRHSVSDDGTRVYFFDLPAPPAPLFVRDGDRTVTVSASKRTGDVGTPHPAVFIAASADGATSYFVSSDQLTDDAPVGGGIYRYNLDTDALQILTPPTGDPSGINPSMAMVAQDGSRIYFISQAVLTPDAQPGDSHLYAWSASGTKLVATVDGNTVVNRMTPDGRYAVISSSASLDGAPNNGHRALYVYDDDTGRIACASCRPDGSPSQADANLDEQPIALLSPNFTAPRNLTLDGGLFFATRDHLVPEDVGAGADIYFYNKGTLSLITPGTADSDAFVADNTDDGHDVMFMSRQRLVSSDIDADNLDLYDARVGGGFPEAPAPSPPCREDDCQGVGGAGRPQLPSAASQTASGPGNVHQGAVRTHVARSVRISKLSSAARRQLARTGRVVVVVKVTGGGTVTVRARGALSGRRATLGSGKRVVHTKRAAVVHVAVRLTPAARSALRGGSRLRVTFEARLSGVSRHSTTTSTLSRR